MNKNYIAEAYESVHTFNDIAGNLNDVTYDSIDNQLSFIFEELTETIDAMETKNRVELLDGACDLYVTVAGLMQKLEAKGYDVARALQRVNQNNLDKFPKVMCSGQWMYVKENQFTPIFNDKHECFVLKDKDGKIRKPVGFKAVNLKDLVGAE